MDIYTYLVRDHRKVARLMDELLNINIQSVQQRMFEDIKAELILHAEAEAATFYAALARQSPDGLRLDLSQRDHAQIETLLQQLTQEGLTSPKWMLMFGELKYAVEHHVAEEEDQVFTEARRLLSPPEAAQLALDMETVKAELRIKKGLSTEHVAQV